MVLLREGKLIKGVCEKEVNSSPHDTSLSPTHHRPGIPCPEDRDSVLRSRHKEAWPALQGMVKWVLQTKTVLNTQK